MSLLGGEHQTCREFGFQILCFWLIINESDHHIGKAIVASSLERGIGKFGAIVPWRSEVVQHSQPRFKAVLVLENSVGDVRSLSAILCETAVIAPVKCSVFCKFVLPLQLRIFGNMRDWGSLSSHEFQILYTSREEMKVDVRGDCKMGAP